MDLDIVHKGYAGAKCWNLVVIGICIHYSMFNISIMYVTKLPGRQLIYFGPSAWNSGSISPSTQSKVERGTNHATQHAFDGEGRFSEAFMYMSPGMKNMEKLFLICVCLFLSL